jgi:hypothetical protein
MKVKDLIEALKNIDPEHNVYVYSDIDEGGDEPRRVLNAEDAIAHLYFKGDAPWYPSRDKNFIVIA